MNIEAIKDILYGKNIKTTLQFYKEISELELLLHNF